MECLTDQFCLISALHNGVTQTTLLVDYLGINLFGGDWQAVTPLVEEQIDALMRIVSRVVPVQPDSCHDTGSQAVLHV